MAGQSSQLSRTSNQKKLSCMISFGTSKSVTSKSRSIGSGTCCSSSSRRSGDRNRPQRDERVRDRARDFDFDTRRRGCSTPGAQEDHHQSQTHDACDATGFPSSEIATAVVRRRHFEPDSKLFLEVGRLSSWQGPHGEAAATCSD